MARVLIICARYPADLSSGADLRFQNIVKQLAKRNDSYLSCFGEIPDGIEPKHHVGVVDYKTLPAFPKSGRSALRHVRITNAHFLQRSSPAYLAEMRSALTKMVDNWHIDVIVCLVPPAAEMITHIDVPIVLDYCDSRTLTFRRMLENRGGKMSLRERASAYLAYFRQRRRERYLVRRFSRTTTIAEADRNCLLEVSGVHPGKVVVVPNGVASEALRQGPNTGERKRSVVFWGNLDFPPNWTAVDFFGENIFFPYLADKNIDWHIIGKGAEESVRNLASHPNIYLHGFVDDLYQEIASHGVMINPMVEGSGLKNKVLEAFACRLPVVSTTMGIDAVGARAGEHYLLADDPAEFADAIRQCLDNKELSENITVAARQFVEEHFEWGAIGEELQQIVRDIKS